MKKYDFSKEGITQLLIDRDKISYGEACNLVEETAEELDTLSFMGIEDAEEILRLNLGLEPDYLEIFLNDF